MKRFSISLKGVLVIVVTGLILSMTTITIALFLTMNQSAILLTGGVLLICSLVWFFILLQFFGRKLSMFTSDLCHILDNMINGGKEPEGLDSNETQFARISHIKILSETRLRLLL